MQELSGRRSIPGASWMMAGVWLGVFAVLAWRPFPRWTWIDICAVVITTPYLLTSAIYCLRRVPRVRLGDHEIADGVTVRGVRRVFLSAFRTSSLPVRDPSFTVTWCPNRVVTARFFLVAGSLALLFAVAAPLGTREDFTLYLVGPAVCASLPFLFLRRRDLAIDRGRRTLRVGFQTVAVSPGTTIHVGGLGDAITFEGAAAIVVPLSPVDLDQVRSIGELLRVGFEDCRVVIDPPPKKWA